MNIKSRQIVPLVGLIVTGYLAFSGGGYSTKPSTFVSKIKDLPEIESFKAPTIDPTVRSIYFTQEVWDEYCAKLEALANAAPAPSPTPQAAPVTAKGSRKGGPVIRPIVVSGILVSPGRRSAIVNGEVLGEGDRNQDITVTKIEPGTIHLRRGDTPMVLSMASPVSGPGIVVRRVSRSRPGPRPVTAAGSPAPPGTGAGVPSPERGR